MVERAAIIAFGFFATSAFLTACASVDDAEPGSARSVGSADRPTLSETATTAPVEPGPMSTTTAQATTTTVPDPLTEAPIDAQPPPLDSTDIGFAPGSTILGLDAEDKVRDLDRMVELGASWVRFDFDWARIETERGNLDWSSVDDLVIEARRRDLRILGLLAYTPRWARPDGASDKAPPDDPEEFARFVGDVLDRYKDHVRAWEIWNEPNVATFWEVGPDPQAYAELLVSASATIRRRDPSALIVTGGLAPAIDRPGEELSPATFLAGMYDAASLESFDAVGIHPYTYPGFPSENQTWNTFAALSDLRALMVDRDDADSPMWFTEFGAPTGSADRAVSESDQARMIDEAIVGVRQFDWAGPLFVYSLRDIEDGSPDDIEDNFGVFRSDGSPKRAAEIVLDRS